MLIFRRVDLETLHKRAPSPKTLGVVYVPLWRPLNFSQIFCEAIYARVAELVLGSAPAGTPGVVDGGARDRRLRTAADSFSQPLRSRSAESFLSHLQATTLARNI